MPSGQDLGRPRRLSPPSLHVRSPVRGERLSEADPAFKRGKVKDIKPYEVREANGWVWVGPSRDLVDGE